MKLNWGTGIAIFYSLFMIAMISMVIKSCNNKSHLVLENYYQKDLGYEDFRIKKNNGKNLKTKITYNYNSNDNILIIKFPKEIESISGKLKLYRPSNKYLDEVYDIKLDSNNSMTINLKKSIESGLWKIQLDWKNQTKKYFNELDLII